jgi:predicted exporter
MNFYLYFVGRMFVDNSNDNLRVVFNWNGITLGVAMGLMAFASFVTTRRSFPNLDQLQRFI